MGKRKVLVTGAAGNIGSRVTQTLSERYELVLLDRDPRDRPGVVQADLRGYDPRWVRHFDQVDTVIHLAANPHTDARWEELIPDNIDSLLHVCGACVKKKVRRLVFASSCQTMEGYRKKGMDKITAKMEPLPANDYGISKVIGEKICRHHSDRFSLSAICLRIGWVPRHGLTKKEAVLSWKRGKWLSDRDLAQVLTRAVEAEEIRFGIFFAVSDNRGMPWDLAPARKVLGYRPRDGLR